MSNSRDYVGYKGFRPAGALLAPSLKTGERLGSRDTKYGTVGHGFVYEEEVRPAVQAAAYT